MPRVGGMELLKGIRTVEEKLKEPRCYFILITGEGTDIDGAEALRASQRASQATQRPAHSPRRGDRPNGETLANAAVLQGQLQGPLGTTREVLFSAKAVVQP